MATPLRSELDAARSDAVEARAETSRYKQRWHGEHQANVQAQQQAHDAVAQAVTHVESLKGQRTTLMAAEADTPRRPQADPATSSRDQVPYDYRISSSGQHGTHEKHLVSPALAPGARTPSLPLRTITTGSPTPRTTPVTARPPIERSRTPTVEPTLEPRLEPPSPLPRRLLRAKPRTKRAFLYDSPSFEPGPRSSTESTTPRPSTAKQLWIPPGPALNRQGTVSSTSSAVPTESSGPLRSRCVGSLNSSLLTPWTASRKSTWIDPY